jgi:hypothetical protein
VFSFPRQAFVVSGFVTIWKTFPKTSKNCLKNGTAQEGLVLTEAQVVALEKAKEEKQAHGEIETHHPGYLGGSGYLLHWHN